MNRASRGCLRSALLLLMAILGHESLMGLSLAHPADMPAPTSHGHRTSPSSPGAHGMPSPLLQNTHHSVCDYGHVGVRRTDDPGIKRIDITRRHAPDGAHTSLLHAGQPAWQEAPHPSGSILTLYQVLLI
ncbi:MAG: hypothetical protein AB7G88_09175 [Thermomicrobiales bacterium]